MMQGNKDYMTYLAQHTSVTSAMLKLVHTGWVTVIARCPEFGVDVLVMCLSCEFVLG